MRRGSKSTRRLNSEITRRSFVVDGVLAGVSVATAGIAESQPVGSFRLLGFDWYVVTSSIQAATPIPLHLKFDGMGIYQGTFKKINAAQGVAEMNVRVLIGPASQQTLSLACCIRVKMRAAGAAWIAEDGPHPQPATSGFSLEEHPHIYDRKVPGSARGLQIEVAGLILTSPRPPTVVVKDGVVRLGIEGPLIGGSGLPFNIECGQPALGAIDIDLSGAAIAFEPGSFTASAHVAVVEPNNYVRRLASPLRSERITLKPRPAADQAEINLSFAPLDAQSVLKLHGSRSNQIRGGRPSAVSAAGLADAKLVASLSRSGSRQTVLHRLRAESNSGAGGPTLVLWTIQDAHGAPVRVQSAKSVLLDVRPATSRPGTILLAKQPIEGKLLDSGQPGEMQLSALATAARFRPGDRRCRVEVDWVVKPGGGGHSSIDMGITSEQTFPVLHIAGSAGSSAEVRVARTGWSYRSAGDGAPESRERYTFRSTNGLGLSTIPGTWCTSSGEESAWKGAAQAADAVMRGATAALEAVAHETARREEPEAASTPLRNVFDRVDVQGTPPRPEFDPYKVCESFQFLCVRLDLPSGERPSFASFDGGAIDVRSNLYLAAERQDFKIVVGAGKDSFGIIKFEGRETLAEIFTKLEGSGRFTKEICAGLLKVVDPEVSRREWVGVMLFDMPVDYGEFTLLKGIFNGELKLQYLACTPRIGNGRGGVSVHARLSYSVKKGETGKLENASDETFFRMETLNASWRDSALVTFDARCKLQFRRFLGSDVGVKPVEIKGSLDQETQTIRFVGATSSPIPLLPSVHPIPILEQVSVRRAEIIVEKQGDDQKAPKAAISVDGEVTTRDLPYPDFRKVDGQPLRFQGLRIRLPEPSSDWLPLKIDYSTLAFDLNFPRLRLGKLELELSGIGVSWPDFILNPWPGFVTVGTPHGTNTDFRWIRLRLDVGELPQLSLKKIGRLSFELIVACRLDGNGIVWGLRGIGFDGLRLDLMRFLELEVKKVELGQIPDSGQPGGKSSCLFLSGITLRVLEKPIFDDLDAFIFGSDQGPGILVYTPNEMNAGWFRVRWLLLGHNLEFASGDSSSPGLPAALNALAPSKPGQQDAERKELVAAVKNGLFVPRRSPVGPWLVGAGISILDLLEGRVVLQDNRYYGIRLSGPLLKEWLGWELDLAVDYFKGATPEEDHFTVALTVPKVLLGAFSLLGGTVVLRVGMSGNFLFDAGFPWRQGNYRDWRRSFGVIVGFLQGAGGLYLQRDRRLAPAGGEDLLVAAGFGAEYGLGASGYSSGPFRVWARVGLYVVVEGVATLRGNKVTSLELTGVVGVLGEASGELNWWVISIRIDITILAEARVQLRLAEGEPAIVKADFTVYARASAHACVGWGPFKACAGINVEIPMRFGPITLQLG